MKRLALGLLMGLLALLVASCSMVNVVGVEAPVYRLYGEVTSEEGVPLEGVHLRFSDGFLVITDEEGLWSREGLKGVLLVTPEKEGYSFHPETSRVDHKRTSGIGFVAFPQEFRLSGRITSEELGISGVEIRFSDGKSPVTTDEGGYWERGGFFREVTVTPSHFDFAFHPPSRVLSRTLAQGLFEGTRTTYGVQGVIRDEKGHPVSGVTLRFSGGYSPVVTNAQGQWEKGRLKGPVEVFPEHSLLVFDPISRSVGNTDPFVDFVARRKTYTVAGRITTEDGRGIPAARIDFLGSEGAFFPVYSGVNGNWIKENLYGEVLVSASKENYVFLPWDQVVTREQAGVDFLGRSGGYVLSGSVKDAKGQAIPHVTIRFSNASSVVTDANGMWEKTGLEGSTRIAPEKTGFSFSPPERVMNGEDHQVDFVGTATVYGVSGRVTNEYNQGISGVVMSFGTGASVLTTEGGFWEKSGLVGEVEVTPEKMGYVFEPAVRKASSNNTHVHFLGRAQYYFVRGRVVDLSGRGMPDVVIRFRNSSSVLTNAEGYWEKERLFGEEVVTPDKYGVTFEPQSRPISYADTHVNFTGDTHVYGASGYVRDNRGNGISDVVIEFGSGVSTLTDSRGYWSKQGLTGVVTVTPQRYGVRFSPESRTIQGESEGLSFVGDSLVYAISGRVVDHSNVGIRGVVIRFSSGSSVLTGDHGFWTKEGLTGEVTVTPDGFGMTFSPEFRVVRQADSHVNFTETTVTYTVSGRVRDNQGAPMKDVVIQSSLGSSALTDENGAWSLSSLRGAVTLTPSKSGVVFTPETLEVLGPNSHVDFVGRSLTYEVEGTVLDSNGAGIPRVVIRFSDGTSTETIADGSWSKTGLTGTVTVTPEKYGYTFTPSSRTVSVADTRVNFVGVSQFYSASGRVLDLANDPMPGVTISFNPGGSVVTDEEGRWTKSDLSGTAVITPEKHGVTFTPATRTVAGATANVNFTGNVFTYDVSGVVLDSRGEAIRDVVVRLSDGTSVETDEKGEWSKTGLTGTVTVTPEKYGYTFTPSSRTVSVADTRVNFVGVSQFYAVSGRVVDLAGLGMPDVTIRFGDGTSTETMVNGSWSKTGLIGTVTVSPEKQGYIFTPSSRTVSAPDTRVDFVGVSQFYSASGQVLDLANVPMPGVTIRFSSGPAVVTNDQGRWERDALTGEVVVTPEKQGVTFSPANVTITQASNQVNFTGNVLTYDVSGTVVDGGGLGIVGVVIRFSDGTSTETTANGGWSKEGLTGTVTVSPEKQGYIFTPGSRTVSAADSRVDFIGVSQFYSASGQVLDLANVPMAGVTIRFSSGPAVVTNDQGRWERDALTGEVVVTPEKQGVTFSPANVTITQASNQVNFTGNVFSYGVSGRVVDSKGLGIADVILSLEDGTSAKTSADGSWSMSGLTGTVEVTPRKYAYTFTPVKRTVSGENHLVDFVGEEGAYKASGIIVTSTGQRLPAVIISFWDTGNNLLGYSITDEEGFWEADLVGTITASFEKQGWVFGPENATITRDSLMVISIATPAAGTYEATGRVRTGTGDDLENVLLVFSVVSAGEETAINYTFTGTGGVWTASLGDSVKVTPSKAGWEFDPPELFIDQFSEYPLNFTAVPSEVVGYEVSGEIISVGGCPVPSVVLEIRDSRGVIITYGVSLAEGDWKVSGLQGVVTVTPRLIGMTFDPPFMTVTQENENVNFVASPIP